MTGGLRVDHAVTSGTFSLDGQIFDVITNGKGLMAGYRWPIPPADRWAIVAYVRELQRKRPATGPGTPASAAASAKPTADSK